MNTEPVRGESIWLDKIDHDEWQLEVLLQRVVKCVANSG